ncbi:class I SAM-dependent methyltransferase [Phenylobacterium sp.]|jgi:SAM-dependent methyltransferase|uniref:class I SAM-dependent methyltransferase n=1 Tax=Phenylobacterium sp. TaxID=1871053 RepID=UPI002E33C601|nr:class I SAM-dependent methyltransferase [Phenylobacterium sp.]HEX2559050.1 class I SAM-dependent methyltransferase [Phenylobacterium sp.]
MERAVYDRMRELEQAHWWFVGRRELLGQVIGRLGLRQEAKILEVGCGVGGNLPLLGRFGSVEALEPDAESRSYVSAKLGVPVADGRLPDGLPYEPGAFDAVCGFDVLEHVEEDAASTRKLAELVAPGGYLVATVPAYRWMWSRHDELHHHRRRYTKDEFEALFSAAGLKIVKASYFNTLLFPLAVAARLAKRVLGLKGEDDRMPPGWLNRILTRVFRWEAGWVARGALPFGLSILVVARRA